MKTSGLIFLTMMFLTSVAQAVNVRASSVEQNHILVVGESLTADPYGQELAYRFKGYFLNHPINRYATADQIGRSVPAAVVVLLGAKDVIGDCKNEDAAKRHAKKILDRIPDGVPCVWVSPTQFRHGSVYRACGMGRLVSEYVATVKAAVSMRCDFVDSTTFTAPGELTPKSARAHPPRSLEVCHQEPEDTRHPDESEHRPIVPNDQNGNHFSNALGRYWGDCVAFEIKEKLHLAGHSADDSDSDGRPVPRSNGLPVVR